MLYGDSGYLGLDKRDEMRRFDGLEYKISRKPSSIKPAPNDSRLLVAEKDEEHRKSSVRCKVERLSV